MQVSHKYELGSAVVSLVSRWCVLTVIPCFLFSCQRAPDPHAPWAVITIRNDIRDIPEPFCYYYRWNSRSPWQHASLHPGETLLHRERCDAECQDTVYFQAQFDHLGIEPMERGRYDLKCYILPTGAASDAASYRILLSGYDPVIKEEPGTPSAGGYYAATDGPVDSFVHPAAATPLSPEERAEIAKKNKELEQLYKKLHEEEAK